MNQSPPIRILLVDDDLLILFTLEKVILKQRDQQVVASVRNGHDALAFLQHNQIDVVLLDIQMPHMSGIDCLQQIRKLYPAIIVILLTSFDEEHYIIEGLARGARSYLLKTATFDYLDQYIRDAINGTFEWHVCDARQYCHQACGFFTTKHRPQQKITQSTLFSDLRLDPHRTANCQIFGQTPFKYRNR